MEALKIITGFITDNSYCIVLIVLMFICRNAISNLISRLTSVQYKNGENHFGIDAVPPIEIIDKTKELTSATERQELPSENVKAEEESKKDDWFSKIYSALEEGRINDADAEFKKFSLEEADENLVEQNKSMYLYYKFTVGKDNNALADLERHANSAKSEESKFSILSWLSLSYSESTQNKKNIDMWRRAVKEIKSQFWLTKTIVSLSSALLDDGFLDEAKNLLVERLAGVKTDEERGFIFGILSKVEYALGNKLISIYCKDKSLEYEINDRDELFNSAYSASNEYVNDISISNYVNLIKIDKDNSIALNNLGVQAQEVGLKLKAVEKFKDSTKFDNTLAIANQGYLLLESGFAQEAEDLAKKALESKDVHPNIHKLMASINEKKEAENKQWNEVIDKALARQKIMRKYMDLYYLGSFHDLEGNWFVRSRYPIVISIDSGFFRCTWIETSGFGRYEDLFELNGEVSGSTFIGHYRRDRDKNSSTTLLGFSGNENIRCLGYFDKDKKVINIFSKDFKENFSLILTR